MLSYHIMYVACHLWTIVKEIQSHVKDTKDFLKNLKQTEEIAEDGLTVTLDDKHPNKEF